MKITLVNTSDIRGGAAIAALRLFRVLKRRLPETQMLVSEKLTLSNDITGLDDSFWQRILNKLHFYLERISFIIRSKNREVWFAFSPANTGKNIACLPEIYGADIIHLHWINNGFLSLKSLHKLVKTGKPIVWTLHDMWAYTGGCHYPGSCSNFTRNCGECFFLKYQSKKDLSHRIYQEKLKIFSSENISFVAVSNWMADNARKSSLISKFKIEVIPNPIDTEVYRPADKEKIRKELKLPPDMFLILSGAANLKDKRKGFIYLVKALSEMVKSHPEISDKIGLITFGKSSEVYDSPIKVYSQSYLKDDQSIARMYQAADVFILPSLEDNLPGTVMESLACGTPVVSFNTGGIPDMVEHKVTGYFAELKNAGDLVAGINWIMDHPEIQKIRENCRKKVLDNFSQELIASKYINFYSSLLK